MKRRIFLILGVFTLLVPFGLLTSSPAWGEWENEYYTKILGYLPKGIADANGIKPLIPDYSYGEGNEILWYYLSAFIGITLIFLSLFILSKIGKKNAN